MTLIRAGLANSEITGVPSTNVEALMKQHYRLIEASLSRSEGTIHVWPGTKSPVPRLL